MRNCASRSDFSSTRGRRGQPVTTLVVPSSKGRSKIHERERDRRIGRIWVDSADRNGRGDRKR